MKRAVVFSIKVYQHAVSPLLHQALGTSVICRYSPSCSEYAKIVIGRYGVFRGGLMATRRLLSCQPFAGSSKTKSR